MSENIAESAERDGGQAFPQPMTVGPSGDLYPAYPGMTLRDWFAGLALQSIILAVAQGHLKSSDGDLSPVKYAEAAYVNADAMLAERSK